MKRPGKTVLLLFTLCLLPAYSEVMKITLNSSSEEIDLGAITSWVFNSGSMNLTGGGSFTIGDISRIEFLPDGSSPIVDASHTGAKEQFSVTANTEMLSLTLPAGKNLRVELYSLNGRRIAELFRGVSSSGQISLQRSTLDIAPAVYSLVVSDGATLFVQKLSL
ncbi:MAG: hypothetical protein GY800_07440 [Planctomycetes bacterium]|nr:hypothetical protein [Planctomycetota bacterium]